MSSRTSHEAPRPMRGSSEAQLHCLRRTYQYPAASSHTSRNQNRLSNGSVLSRDIRMLWGDRAGRALSMDDDFCSLAINVVRLNLRDVVTDVVDNSHIH